jgi:hypothetical protein
MKSSDTEVHPYGICLAKNVAHGATSTNRVDGFARERAPSYQHNMRQWALTLKYENDDGEMVLTGDAFVNAIECAQNEGSTTGKDLVAPPPVLFRPENGWNVKSGYDKDKAAKARAAKRRVKEPELDVDGSADSNSGKSKRSRTKR